MVGSKGEVSRRMVQPQGETMRAPDEVAAMVRLRALGWGVRRIAAELGCSHMTVRRYLAEGGWAAYRTPRRAKALDGLEGWLAERFRRHRGNADVVRQELLAGAETARKPDGGAPETPIRSPETAEYRPA